MTGELGVTAASLDSFVPAATDSSPKTFQDMTLALDLTLTVLAPFPASCSSF